MAKKAIVHITDTAADFIDDAWKRYKKTKDFSELSAVALTAVQLRHCADLERLLDVQSPELRKQEITRKQLQEAHRQLGEIVRTFRKPARYKRSAR